MAVSKQKTGDERTERRKMASGVKVEALLQNGGAPADCVDSMIAAPSIESLIAEAQSGDKTAAKRVLALASAYIKHKLYGPLPRALRGYLGNALAKASLGVSADVALNLKRDGRPRQTHRTKLEIGHLIYRAMQCGKSLEAACFDCQDFIEANIKVHGRIYGYTKVPDHKTLERIYCEALPDIKANYKEVLSSTFTPET